MSDLTGSGATDPISSMLGMGSSGASSSPLASAFSSPQMAKALANAQKAVSSTAQAAGSAVTGLTSAASTKAKNAVAWANGMVGRQDWNNLCERFVEEAYGTRGVYPAAKDAAQHLVTHRGSSSLKTAPAGALLYFAPDDTNEGAGHAAIYLGNGEMVSARPDGVQVEKVDTPYNSARYLGWGSPPAKFPGRRSAAATASGTRPTAAAGAKPNSAAQTPLNQLGSALNSVLTPRAAPASGSSPSSSGLVPPPPSLRLPPRSAGSPR